MRFANHVALGAFGEDLAEAHLRRDGMRILERNWRCRSGELDIVAIDHGETVFCEVKTRRSIRRGTPMEAIDPAKTTQIKKLVAIWRRDNPRYRQRYRYDVVCLLIHSDCHARLDHRRGAL